MLGFLAHIWMITNDNAALKHLAFHYWKTEIEQTMRPLAYLGIMNGGVQGNQGARGEDRFTEGCSFRKAIRISHTNNI